MPLVDFGALKPPEGDECSGQQRAQINFGSLLNLGDAPPWELIGNLINGAVGGVCVDGKCDGDVEKYLQDDKWNTTKVEGEGAKTADGKVVGGKLEQTVLIDVYIKSWDKGYKFGIDLYLYQMILKGRRRIQTWQS